jgi:hypothetical protein
MCPDCQAEAVATKQKQRTASVKKAKAIGRLVMDMVVAFGPIFKPIWDMTLTKPITVLFVVLVGWSMLSGPSQDQKPNRPAVSSPSPKSTPKATVANSGWDGAVWQVEYYLERNLKDPDSFEAIEWSHVIDNGNGYAVRCRYRAKNSFGGYNIEEQLFVMDKQGDVISVAEWGQP